MLKTLTLVFVNITLLVLGQILWKMALNRVGPLSGVKDLLLVARSPLIWSGIFLYVLATGVWLIALSRAELSRIYPVQSLAYLFGMIGGVVLLGERVALSGWLGGILILTGIFLVCGLRR